ncbi:MAG TPA: BTAD domain-containing putative transcriptional regulator [Streptosporangiaceae bacterium]|nr:BTAD domain-containing putative transcriptional regulator [Streptosporangiaceae bacterium]
MLGLLQIDDEAGGARPVAGDRQRVLLAALLVRANRVVPADELAEIVWDGAPPAGATALRTQVMRLRRALGPDAAGRIAARRPGYVITLSADEFDVTLFEALHQDAAAAMRAGRWRDAVSALDRALALWRGAALLDVDSQVLRDECCDYLEQLRVQEGTRHRAGNGARRHA